MPDVLSAVTETVPPIAVVASPISLLVILASVELCTRLVAMVALTAKDVPVPNALPPDDDTSLNMVAWICAFESASTVTSPPAATSVLSIKESTSLRTSLRTTSPPMATESEPVTLPILGM